MKADIDTARHHPEGDMRRHGTAILERDNPRLDGLKNEFPTFHIRRTTPPTGKVGIGLPAGFRRAVVKTLCIGLPDFHQRIFQRCSGPVINATANGNPFPFRLIVGHALPEIFRVNPFHSGKIRSAADMDIRSCGLRWRFLEID